VVPMRMKMQQQRKKLLKALKVKTAKKLLVKVRAAKSSLFAEGLCCPFRLIAK